MNLLRWGRIPNCLAVGSLHNTSKPQLYPSIKPFQKGPVILIISNASKNCVLILFNVNPLYKRQTLEWRLCASPIWENSTISSSMWVRSELNSWECLQLKSFIIRDFMFLMTCTIATVFFSSITCKNSLFLEWVILRLLFLELTRNLWLRLRKAKARLRNEPSRLFDLSEHESQGVTDIEALVSKLTFRASWWGLAQINEGAVGLNPELPENVHELESQEHSTICGCFILACGKVSFLASSYSLM